MKGNSILLIFCVLLCLSCRNNLKKTGEITFPVPDSIPVSETEKLSPEAIADISKNISSPVEIANLLQTLGVPFSQEYLASSVDPDKSCDNFKKALNLGILGADLGYLNMYEKTASSLDLLSGIRKLAEDIGVGRYFDFESIKRLSRNRSNLDSLLFISINSYNQIDTYLRANDMGQLSALMIIGVWIEGQYLATQVVSQFPDKMLSDRIGEQKIILNDLLLLTTPYLNQSDEYRKLHEDLIKIKDAYRPVRITFTQGKPVSVEKNGGLVVTQTETSMVEMSQGQLNSIIEITDSIRNRLISNN